MMQVLLTRLIKEEEESKQMTVASKSQQTSTVQLFFRFWKDLVEFSAGRILQLDGFVNSCNRLPLFPRKSGRKC